MKNLSTTATTTTTNIASYMIHLILGTMSEALIWRPQKYLTKNGFITQYGEKKKRNIEGRLSQKEPLFDTQHN